MAPTKYPPCGRLCEDETCEGKRLGLCSGCIKCKGSPPGCIKSEKPKEYQGIKVCPIWECAEKHKLEYCAQCKKFPCKLFLSWYDPKNGQKSVLLYVGLLLIRRNLGIEKWINWVKIHKKK